MTKFHRECVRQAESLGATDVQIIYKTKHAFLVGKINGVPFRRPMSLGTGTGDPRAMANNIAALRRLKARGAEQ